jgi:lactoylglutathione lyase
MKDLNLLVLRCNDIEQAMRFYSLLGMTFKKHAHGNGPEHYAHEDERGVFELYPRTNDVADATGLGFSVVDLEQTRPIFAEAGFAAGEIRETEWGRSFEIRDPDQRRVEIKQK